MDQAIALQGKGKIVDVINDPFHFTKMASSLALHLY